MIRQVITNIVFSSTGLAMEHGDKGWINLQSDEAPGQTVYLVDPIKFDITNLTYLKESYPVVMLFLGKSELDINSTELDAITDAQRQNVRAFIAGCRDSGEITTISNINSIEVLHFSDADYSGWMVYATLELADAGLACF